MKNLVIAVSPDSSLKLLGEFADIIVLDKESVPNIIPFYESLYVRSHFGSPETLPQVFRAEIEDIIYRTKQKNPKIKFIDGISSVDMIVDTEDKWRQYEVFKGFMPNTNLLHDNLNVSSFQRPVFKKRLSSRGKGVTWDISDTTIPREDWIIQESIGIAEELRIYVAKGKVYPVGAIRRSKAFNQNTRAVDSRPLAQDEIGFSFEVWQRAPSLDIIGLDVARTSDGKLY